VPRWPPCPPFASIKTDLRTEEETPQSVGEPVFHYSFSGGESLTKGPRGYSTAESGVCMQQTRRSPSSGSFCRRKQAGHSVKVTLCQVLTSRTPSAPERYRSISTSFGPSVTRYLFGLFFDLVYRFSYLLLDGEH
jgi:hypothetical protein